MRGRQHARTIADIIRFRLQMIAAGDEDGNDATGLRLDPLFKLAVERLQSGSDLCSHSTISRLENLPDARTLLRLGRALVDLYCASFRQLAKGIVLDIDDTFDAVPGSQQLCLFDAHDDDDSFQRIVIFAAGDRFVTAALRPAKRPKDVEIGDFLRRLIRAIRVTWPQNTLHISSRLSSDTPHGRGHRFNPCRAHHFIRRCDARALSWRASWLAPARLSRVSFVAVAAAARAVPCSATAR